MIEILRIFKKAKKKHVLISICIYCHFLPVIAPIFNGSSPLGPLEPSIIIASISTSASRVKAEPKPIKKFNSENIF